MSGWSPARPGWRLLLVLAGAAVAVALVPSAQAVFSTDGVFYGAADTQEAIGPGGPTYQWATMNTPLVGPTCDDCTTTRALGFTYDFYGSPKTTVCISSNGHIDFGTCSTDLSPDAVPSTTNPDEIAPAYWDDLNPAACGTISAGPKAGAIAPDRVFIVQYSGVCHYGGSTPSVSMQWHLFEANGLMEVHYQQAIGGASGVSAGIENVDGSVGVQYQRGFSVTTPTTVQYRPFGLVPSTADDPLTPARTLDYIAGGLTGILNVAPADGVSGNDGPGYGSAPVMPVLLSSDPDLQVTLNPDGSFDAVFLNGIDACTSGPFGDGRYQFTYAQSDVFTLNDPIAFPPDAATVTVKAEHCPVPPVYAEPGPFAVAENAPDLPDAVINGDFDDYFTDNDDPGDDAQLQFTASISPSGAGILQPGGARRDRWSFDPASHFNGPVTVTVSAADPYVATTTGTFRIDVLARNNAPVLVTKTAAGPLIHEHATNVKVPLAGWTQTAATMAGVEPASPAPAVSESLQAVSFTAGTASPLTPFAAGGEPFVNSANELVFTLQGPGSDFHSSFTVPVVMCDDGRDEGPVGTLTLNPKCVSGTVTVVVGEVNDPPFATAVYDPPDLVEDAGARTELIVVGLRPGPPDEAGQSVSITSMTVEDPLGILAAEPSLTMVSDRVSVTFRAKDDRSGTVLLHLVASDDGPAGGPHANTVPLTVTLAIAPVNDRPDFTLRAAPQAAEDSGAQSIASFATVTTWGAADEDGDGASWTLTPDRPDMFAAGPDIAPDGTLTFTPAPDAHGTATVTVALDDGDGGDSTRTRTTTVTLTPVNDPPTISVPDVTVQEDAGAVDLAAWGTVAAGPLAPPSALEPGVVTVVLDAADESLFSVQPTMDASGRLRFTPAPQQYGSTTVAAVAQDGTLSATTTFMIVVEPVNDAPVAVADAFGEWGSSPVVLDVLANDSDGDGDELVIVDVTVPTSGTATMQPGQKAISYDAGGHIGAATFTYTVFDGTATDTALVTVTTRSNPHAVADAFTWPESPDATATALPFDVAANDLADPDLPAPTYEASVVTGVATGTLTKTGPSTFTFTPPDGDWNGQVSFVYGYATGAQATVTITVAPSNDAPGGQDDTFAMWQGITERLGVLANDVDADGDIVRVKVGSVTTTHGSATVAPDGRAILFTPPAGFAGDATLTYVPTDGQADGAAVSVAVHVEDPADPAARLVTPTGTLCAGDTLALSASGHYAGHAAEAYAWTVGAATRAGPSVSYTPAGHGTLPVTVTVTFDDDATATAARSLQVLHCTAPTAAFTSVVSGPTVTFTDASTGTGSIVSWSWSFGDGQTSGVRSPVHVYEPGTYTVRLIVQNSEGGVGAVEKTITIEAPAPAPDPAPPSSPPSPPSAPPAPAPAQPPFEDPRVPMDVPVPLPEQPDSDGDGVPDPSDAFPYDATEWQDLDGDGIGDGADTDTDGDTVPDSVEEAAGTDPRDPRSFPVGSVGEAQSTPDTDAGAPWWAFGLIAALVLAIVVNVWVVVWVKRRGST